MNNKEFDDIIKKKLESLNTDGSEGAWDLFKEKWDNKSNQDLGSEELSNQDKDLDAKIKSDMQKLRVPFNSKHWIILKEQLELEALFKKKLFVAKSVELIILAFLVLGILNLWPIQKNIYQIPIDANPMVASVPVDKTSAENHKAIEEAQVSKQKDLNSQLLITTQTLVQKALASVERIANNQTPSSKERTNNVSKIKTKPSEHRINNVEFPFLSTPQKTTEPIIENNNNGPIALLEVIEINALEIPIRSTGKPNLDINYIKSPKGNNSYISFALGPKMNLVNSPFDPIYEIDPSNTINTNFNISARIHKEFGPIELYTGLGYSNTSYVPHLVDEIYESLESQFSIATLENIKFKTFNVPLGVKYNIYESKKYELYASAGVDFNVIADSEYIIQDELLGRQAPAQPASPKEIVNSNSKLSQKEFNKGILSGGSLKDNLYATASVSFGLNWKATHSTGLFIEPRYSHFTSSDGIGPNADKVHGLSIDLGVKFLLN